MIHGLYVIIDLKVARGDVGKITEDVIKGGANLIQLRAKEVSTSEFLRAGTEIEKICRKSGIHFIINDRVDVALALNSDGVHLGQDDMPVSIARKLIGRKKLIGLSVHSLEEAKSLYLEKPDYIGIGPIFFTKTKANAGPLVGTELIRDIKKEINIPLVAIGGINTENICEVVEADADAAAVCSAILRADNIREATEELAGRINLATTVGA